MEPSLIKKAIFIENVQSVYFITKINKRRLLYSHEKFTALKVWYSFCNFSPILFILLLLTFYFLFCIHFNISWNVTGKKLLLWFYWLIDLNPTWKYVLSIWFLVVLCNFLKNRLSEYNWTEILKMVGSSTDFLFSEDLEAVLFLIEFDSFNKSPESAKAETFW